MAATDVLRSRSNGKIIEQKYIERVLKEEGREALRAQDKVIARYNARKIVPELNRRRITVTNNRLTFIHPIRQRFIDMKNIRGQRQRAIELHNKILFSHFNSIVGRLAHGYTEDLKNMIAQDLKIQL